jgi:archaeal type IV pilus assembly protein PilA
MMAITGDESMNKPMKRTNEHAVSPVVGVMLMLVVTIIIAAVVSAFSGGLTAGKEKAPQASLETHIQLNGGMSGADPSMIIKHLGGDPINTRNTKLVTSWANGTGVYHVASTVAAVYNTTTATYDQSSLNTNSGEYFNEPYLIVPGVWPGSDNTLWFGNYIMRAGDVIKVDSNLATGPYGNAVTDKPIIRDADLLTGNEIVNVKLIDLKSGSAIYDKDVIVEA